MKTRIDVHADFGNTCADSRTAYNYLRNVINSIENLETEQKITRQTASLGYFVQMTLLWDNTATTKDEVNSLLDTIHEKALGKCGYEHMDLIDFELVDPLTP